MRNIRRLDDGNPTNRLHRRGPLGVVVLMLLLLWQAGAAMQGVKTGMRLCAYTMIPALFPFMVVSEWMVRGDAGEMLASWWPLRRFGAVLGLSQAGLCAFLMGVLCGFPIGARVAAAYYRRGRLEANEFSRVLCLCNLPSTAFLVNAVGAGLFGSAALGRWLCLLSFASALLIGLVLRMGDVVRGRKRRTVACACVTLGQQSKQTLPSVLSAAAGSMLNVCATVILFSSLTSVLDCALAQAGVSPGARGRACLLGLLELSGGAAEVAAAFEPVPAAVMCAALVGWGGFSVHCQIFSECVGCPLKRLAFWLSRLVQAFLCGAGMALLISTGVLMPPSAATDGVIAQVGRFPSDVPGRIVWSLCMGGMIVATAGGIYLKRTKRRAYGRSK